MSTVGQAAGGLVGGIAGFFIGGPSGAIYGAQIGLMAGGYLDPPKGPKGRPPGADQLTVQTSTYGAPLKRGYGTYATYGNVFWVKGNKLDAVEKKQKQKSGKGGSKQTASTWEVFGTFAIGFHLGEITAYKRIWFGSKLVYDAGASTIGAIMATNETGGSLALYTGSPTQLPDPLIQADMGVGSTPGYRGLAYIVVNNWPLAEWGNSLAGLQIKAELVVDGTVTQYDRRVYVPNDLYTPFAVECSDYSAGKGPYNPKIKNGLFSFSKEQYTYTLSYEGSLVSRAPSGVIPGVPGDVGERFFVGYLGNSAVYYDNTVPPGGDLKIGSAVFASRQGNTTDAFCGACIGGDGRLYMLMSTAGVGRLDIYDDSLNLISSQPQSIYVGSNTISHPAVPGSQITFCVEGGSYLWAANSLGTTNALDLYAISSSGALTPLWGYTAAFYGTYGLYACMAAENGLCYHATDGGSLAIFDRSRIIASTLVPLADVLRAECLQSGILDSADIDTSEITQTLRGYEIAQTASIRSALEPLQAAWPFDIIPHGYQIKFVPRGKSSVATIDILELGTTADGGGAVQITTAREMDSQLPRRVSVKYRNANREYDSDVGPGAERLNSDAVNIITVDLSLVMTEAEAAGVEQVLLYMYWLERHDVSFTLPPVYRNLEPADVVTINGNAATYLLRLTEINDLPDGRLECKAKYNAVAIYTPNVVAQVTANSPKMLSFAGPSLLQLLDIPCIDSTVMNKPGILAAVSGYFAGWPGGTLFRSDDSGQTWNDVQGFTAPGCTIGYATNSIGPVSRYSVDPGSMLNVRLVTGALFSVTQDAMLNGANHFAYGGHGRWEIIAAQNCVQQANDTYTLSNLLRGRFGTEQYMDDHTEVDVIVLLDSDEVRFSGMDIASINLTRLWRPVTSGQMVDAAAETALAYSGVNLKPLSPVDVKASIDGTNGTWAVTWTRRTRTPVEPFSGAAVPVAESAESYRVEICSSGFSTVLRTVSGLSSPSFSYSVAQQTADYGGAVSQIYIRIYQVSSTLGNGYPAVETLFASLSLVDPNWASVVIGLHCEGANNSTTFTDVKGNTITAGGNAKITTGWSAFGLSSGLFDGSGDYLDCGALAPKNGDFTFDLQLRLTAASKVQIIASSYNIGTAQTNAMVLMIKATNVISLYVGGASAIDGNTVLSANTRYHIEVGYRHSDKMVFIFVNGVLDVSGALPNQITAGTTLWVGGSPGDNNIGTDWLDANIDEFRLTSALRHTATFTPPFAAFPEQ